MAAIGRFQNGDDVFHAKVVDGELFRLQGDVFGSPTYDKKPLKIKGLRTLTPVVPSKIIAAFLNMPRERAFTPGHGERVVPDYLVINIHAITHPQL